MFASKADVVALARELLAAVHAKLAKVRAIELAQFESELTRLDKEATRSPAFSVCFLGNAGVGKTTLINAVVDPRRRVLPEGGIGPLTARETRVVDAPSATLEVEYRSAPELEQWQERLLSESTDARVVMANNHLRGLIQLAVSGTQFQAQPIEYLVDALRGIQGQRDRFRSALHTADVDRVAVARTRLASRTYRSSPSGDVTSFLGDVALHTTGALAPLVRSVTVGWRSGALPGGLTLVDLPGLGVVNDAYQEATLRYLSDEGAISVVVVDRAGLVDSVAQPLQETGLFRRLLHGINEAGRALGVLTIAVVKLDLTANDARHADKSRPWIDHLAEANKKAVVLLQSQLRQQLEMAAAGLAGPSGCGASVNRALAAIQVLPLLPTEAQRWATEDPEAPAKVEEDAHTGVPDFIERMALALQRADALEQEQFVCRVLDFQNRVRLATETQPRRPPVVEPR